MAAEDDAAGAADAQPAKQDWGADADDNALPPLSNMGWADDDEDELPPLDPTWANLPVPDSPKREKPPAAFKPRDDRGGAEPRASVFSRLGEGTRGVARTPPIAAGRPRRPASRDPPAAGGRIPRGPPRAQNPHDWHREQMRLQEAARRAVSSPSPVTERASFAERERASADTAERGAGGGCTSPRDAQRAAALKRGGWRRLARDRRDVPRDREPFDGEPPGEPFGGVRALGGREMLNALSEPRSRRVTGRTRRLRRRRVGVQERRDAAEEEVWAVVGVRRCCATCWRTAAATPGRRPLIDGHHRRADAPRSSHSPPRWRCSRGGDPRRGSRASKTCARRRRRTPARAEAGQKMVGAGAGAGAGSGGVFRRGDKGHKGDKGDKVDKGAAPEKLQASKPESRRPEPAGADRGRTARWEKTRGAPAPREESSASRRVSREGAREPLPPTAAARRRAAAAALGGEGQPLRGGCRRAGRPEGGVPRRAKRRT